MATKNRRRFIHLQCFIYLLCIHLVWIGCCDDVQCIGSIEYSSEGQVICTQYRAFQEYVLHEMNQSTNGSTSLWINSSYITDTTVSCGDWSDTNLGDRQFGIISGIRTEIRGSAELWLKVELPSGLTAGNISAAHLFLKGAARGAGQGARSAVHDAPWAWAESNLTCALARGANATAAGYPVHLARLSVTHSYGWHKLNVTESVIAQLPYSQQLNLRWLAEDSDQAPNHWFTTQSHYPPGLLIQL
mmetsp:Transcript_18674/g.35026  ORF Transcript_18674/g.35026 Transcript_18674/m.35026 type:complete len:245 (+) Transcript_18674:66-800(+)